MFKQFLSGCFLVVFGIVVFTLILGIIGAALHG